MEEKKERAEIIKMQADFSCDMNCLSCERFFQCENPAKWEVYKRSRMVRVREVLKGVKHKIAVIAGKGGVGKSMVSSNLATALAMKGYKVGIFDNDFDGPCIPKMLGVTDKKLYMTKKGIEPVEALLGIKVVSTGLIMPEWECLVWYHDLRRNAEEEFLGHVLWGDLDYLILDLPPGTSSDAINMMVYVQDLDGVVAVTMPQMVSQAVVRKAILLTLQAGFRVLGVIENMSGFVCPHCNAEFDVLLGGGGEYLSKSLNVPFLGKIPIDQRLSECSDAGVPFVYKYPDIPSSKRMFEITDKIIEMVEKGKEGGG